MKVSSVEHNRRAYVQVWVGELSYLATICGRGQLVASTCGCRTVRSGQSGLTVSSHRHPKHPSTANPEWDKSPENGHQWRADGQPTVRYFGRFLDCYSSVESKQTVVDWRRVGHGSGPSTGRVGSGLVGSSVKMSNKYAIHPRELINCWL